MAASGDQALNSVNEREIERLQMRQRLGTYLAVLAGTLYNRTIWNAAPTLNRLDLLWKGAQICPGHHRARGCRYNRTIWNAGECDWICCGKAYKYVTICPGRLYGPECLTSGNNGGQIDLCSHRVRRVYLHLDEILSGPYRALGGNDSDIFSIVRDNHWRRC